MWCFYVLFFVFCNASQSQATVNKPDKPITMSSDQKVWNIILDINFLKPLPVIMKKPTGMDVRLRCEAVMNFTKIEKYTKNKDKIESSSKDSPPVHILQTLMSNIKSNWLKDDKKIEYNDRRKEFTKIDPLNRTISTVLKIKNASKDDEANYTCIIKHNYERKQSTRLEIIDPDFDVPTYETLFPESVTIKATAEPEQMKTVNSYVEPTSSAKHLEPLCQEYIGNVCKNYLAGQFVYIPYNITQSALEEKLTTAVRVTNYSNDISKNCVGYALPSLCYSTFPICRTAMAVNDYFFKEIHSLQTNVLDPEEMSKVAMEKFDYRLNSSVLRRVCKQDCVVLENELCQTEYIIAKRHPLIGKQLNLEECFNLPEEDPDCLKVGISAIVISDDECYWEDGNGYLGRANITQSGVQCMIWSEQFQVTARDYPELAGRHNYCRNPGSMMSQPWCFVEKGVKQLCEIPKCAHKIWIYIVVVFLLLTIMILAFIICLCCRNKNKNSPNISDMNLPSVDKNIYGNSRMNSPVEMHDLLANQNQPHLTHNSRGNNPIRVPQYSLTQIKFLEELGEGAFGKVYKGALKLGNETTHVAVKALKENASAKTQSDFKREIDLISELQHENIVCIVGVALREEPLCMLFEFMARGDLHEFLMGRAPPSGKGLPPIRLLNIAMNIASGMHYLASHHYVHRDLAARNCLVSDDFVVKISDFGLSRDIYSSDYYRVQSKSLLPVRWMPPESILYGKFTTESDIWSYGVVLWEIYSYGLQPYYGYSNQEVIAMVRAGELLAPPTACPPAVYTLMRDCWKHTPQRRPKFDEIVNRIQSWVEHGGCPESEASGSLRDLQERVPLLPSHYPSNGSLATNSLKKMSLPTRVFDDTCSNCSEPPPVGPKTKKGSSGSLIDSDRLSVKETVVRIPNSQFGNDI